MSNRRAAAFSTALTTLANLTFSLITSFVLLPLYTKIIGARVYGAWSGLSDLLMWLQAFDFGIPNVLIQKVAEASSRDDKKDVAKWFSACMLCIILVSLCIAAGGLLLGQFVAGWLKGLSPTERDHLKGAFQVGVVTSGLQVFNYGIIGYSRAVQRIRLMNMATMAVTPLSIVICLPLLFMGFGVYSIVLTLLARSACIALVGLFFIYTEIRSDELSLVKPDGAQFMQVLRLMPATLLGGIAYAVTNQSELFILNMTQSPTVAFHYLAMRRAVEIPKVISDTVAFSSYGAFAHLANSGEKSKVLQVFRQLENMRLSLATILIVPYIALNSSFVLALFKGATQPDVTTIILIGIQALVAGNSFLANYLYRATGEVVKGSMVQVGEALCKLVLAVVATHYFGSIALPMVAIPTSCFFWYLSVRGVKAKYYPTEMAKLSPPIVHATRAALILAAIGIGATVRLPNWGFILAAGAVLTAIAAVCISKVDPSVDSVRDKLLGAVKKLRWRRAT